MVAPIMLLATAALTSLGTLIATHYNTRNLKHISVGEQVASIMGRQPFLEIEQSQLEVARNHCYQVLSDQWLDVFFTRADLDYNLDGIVAPHVADYYQNLVSLAEESYWKIHDECDGLVGRMELKQKNY
jgi:hypothetical protein